MTDEALIEQLRKLVEVWRKTAHKAYSDEAYNAIDECADELESLLEGK